VLSVLLFVVALLGGGEQDIPGHHIRPQLRGAVPAEEAEQARDERASRTVCRKPALAMHWVHDLHNAQVWLRPRLLLRTRICCTDMSVEGRT
jgi:hypothetical protein